VRLMLSCKPVEFAAPMRVTQEDTGLEWVSKSRNPGDRSTRQVGALQVWALSQNWQRRSHGAKRMKIWRVPTLSPSP